MNLSAMTREQLEAMVLSSQRQAKRKLTMKVSKAGAMSIYGFGRWPVTLYKAQWLAVMDMVEDVRQFLEANDSLLSQGKDDPTFAKADAE